MKLITGNFTGFRQAIVKNSFFVVWYALVLSLITSCTSPSPEDIFDPQEGRTLHSLHNFLLSVSMELQMEDEKEEAESVEESGETGVASTPVTGASSGKKLKQRQFKTVDWLEAPLKEEHLKKMGALHIKTVSEGEPVQNSTSQVGAFKDTDAYSRVPFNIQYYRLDYELLNAKLPPHTNIDSIKDDKKKLWAFLLGKVNRFYGFPDTDYYILPHVESNYLILYRLGRPDTIPYDQLPLARPVGDFLATPLVGYPVEYCLPEKDKNILGETVDQSIPYCEGISLGSAKYIRFQTDEEHRKLFEYKEKLDLFSADFFNGEWFYLKTEIQSSTKIKDNDDIKDPSFQTASLVEFQKKSNHLAVMDSSQYGLDEKDRQPVLFIPVQWKEYELDRDLNFFNSFSEREKKPAGQDVKRPYFLLDFQQLKNLNQSGSSGVTRTVKNVLVTDDFVSFNIETNRKGRSFSVEKHSFRRTVDNPDYPQKQWYEEDSSTFHPVSYIEQKHYVTSLHHTKADKEQFYRVTRFDPNKEEIRWYFSTQTPKDDWVRDFGRLAIAYEDRAFQEAGKHSPRKIRVVLDEEGGDKELGDTRYNIINLVVTENPKPTAFGVGSHVAHPVTGEIVSATANVWVSHIVDKKYVPLVRQYIRFHIWPPSWKLLPSSHGVSDFLHGKIQTLCPEVKEFIGGKQGIVPPLHPIRSKDVLDDGDLQIQCARKLARTHILYEVMQAIRHGHGFRHVFSASADTEHHYKNYDEIKDLFGDVEKIHNSPSPSWEDNLIKDQKDWEGNLIKDQTAPPYFSSVMDHSSIDFPILSVPGKYDIAATRYLYFDQLETVDNKGLVDGYVTLNSGDKSIKQEIAEGLVLFTDLKSKQNQKQIDEDQLKKYYVCGGKNLRQNIPDEHGEDPFCNGFDYGRTPEELIAGKIRSIQNDLMLYSRRYDSDELLDFPVANPQHFSKFIIKWSKLRNQALAALGTEIYDFSAFSDSSIEDYEGIIATAIKEEKARYLEQMTEAEKAECVRNRGSSAAGAELSECAYSDLEAYSAIIPHLADFYHKLLFLPPKQCVYQTKSGGEVFYKTVELEVLKAKVKNIYPEGSTEALFNCQFEGLKKWAAQQDLVFIAEVGGFSLRSGSVKYLIQPPANDPGDEYAMGVYNMLKKKIKIVTIEPDVRKVFFQEVRDFMLKGYDLNPYLDKISLRQNMGLTANEDLPRLPRFSSYEITDLILHAKLNQLQIYKALEERQYVMELGFRFDKFRRQIKIHHNLIGKDDISGLKIQLSQFIEGIEDNPDPVTKRMSIIYGEHWPFIYQAYQRYMGDYNTPEKRQSTSFPNYLTNLPSVLSLFSMGGNILYVPFDEKSMWTGIFRKYQEYKACLESADTMAEELNGAIKASQDTATASTIGIEGLNDDKMEVENSEQERFREAIAEWDIEKIISDSSSGCKERKEKEAYIKLINGILQDAQAME